jgi:hypothetical protein
MKKIILILFAVNLILAQELTVSATNTMRFGAGREWAGDNKDVEVKKQYFEDWLDIYASKGDFSAGLRFEVADSSSHNEALSEFTKLFFNYSKENISLTVGDFYGSFGRGLVFGLKDSKADFFDSKVTGGLFEYSGGYFSIKTLGGKSYFKYIDDSDPAIKPEKVEQMNNAVLGTELILPAAQYFGTEDFVLNIGGSYLSLKGDAVPETQYLYNTSFIEETDIFGLSAEFSAFDVEFFNEYAVKVTDRTPSQTGWANYSYLSYTVEGFSAAIEYLDMYKYGVNPNDIASGFTPYQIAPAAHIHHYSHLLNTHPHQPNPNDEIGFKFTSEYQINKAAGLNFAAAFASVHDGDSVFPGFSDQDLPYNDYWLGADYVAEKYGLKAGFGYMKDSPMQKYPNEDLYYGKIDSIKTYTDTRTTFMGEYGFKLNNHAEFSLSAEYQKVSNGFLDKDYNDIYGSVEYGHHSYGYLNVSVITTSEEVAEGSPDSWFGVEAGINIKENHKLEIFYGRERAGVKCAGGTCRQVPEFDGLRLTLVSDL